MANIRPFPIQHFWDQLIGYLPDAVICTDSSRTITRVNDAACSLLGYTREHFEGLPLAAVFPECQSCTNHASGKGCFFTPVQSENEGKVSCEVQVRAHSGELIPVLLSTNRIDNPDNEASTIHFAILKDIRPFKQAENRLNQEKSRFEYLFNNITDAVFLSPIDSDGVHGNFVEVNDVACERLGYTREELLQLNARTINPQANLVKVKSFGRNIKREGKTIFEAIHVAKDGTQIPVEVVAKVIRFDDKNYVLSIVRDMREQQEMVRAQERFGKLMDHSWDEIYVFSSDTLKFVQVNQGALDNLGYSKKEILELKVTDIKPDLTVNQFRALTSPLFDGTKSQIIFESNHQRKDRSTYPVEIRLQLSHNEVPPVFLANVQDITERKKTEQRLTFLANYDPLTGLPNRSLFMDRLNMAMEGSKRSSLLTAVIFLDLDGFKSVNDTLGHEAGDLLIKEVGRRLTECVRKSDTVARLGGDEFTLILTNIRNVEGVEVVAEKVLEVLSRPFCIYDTEVQTTSSLGVTIFPMADADDAFMLIKQADTAMYHAKATGKNNCKFYTASLAQEELKRVSIENALRKALSNNEFHLLYQPRIDLSTGRVAGAEALLRWESEKLGPIPPLEFIPVLEASGMIRDVGHWVLKKALQQLRDWSGAGINLRLSINVSARQFEDGLFPAQLEAALAQYDVPASNLEIEITENVLLSKASDGSEGLKRVKQTGVKISLDDFGTGYSSLSYLKQFPIDVLKIDRSFIMDLGRNNDSAAIVDAIISLARSLGLSVTAEGIEEQAQAELLQEKMCEEGQGYLFGRPMPANELEVLCKERNQADIISVPNSRSR